MSDDWFEKYLRLIRQLERLLEPQRRLQDQMDKLLEPQRRLQEQMNKWLEPQRRLHEQISEWFKPIEMENYLADILNKTNYDDIKYYSNGAISVEGEVFFANEFVDKYHYLFKSLEKLPSPAQALNFIWVFLQKTKKPIAQVLLLIILPFIITLTANLSTPYFGNTVYELASKTKREKIKAIRIEAQRDFDLDWLKDYRFISVTTLNVRRNSSIKSKIVDEIHFGQVVKLMKRGRKWSLIEYIDEDTDLKVEGRVFNRYLSKFN